MYHSITFIDMDTGKEVNTYDDWGLVAKTRPFIAPPAPKTNFIDIPGASVKLDFSEALTKYPTYENRTGEFEFIIPDQYISDKERTWMYKYTEIMSHINGRHLKMILEDDDEYFYEGRFSVDSYKPGSSASDSFSTIKIKYDVGPYKWTLNEVWEDNWKWDPFSFVDGVITSRIVRINNFSNEWSTMYLDKDVIGTAPVCPEIYVTQTNWYQTPATLRVTNDYLGIDITKSITRSDNKFYDIVLYADPYEKYIEGQPFKGSTISIKSYQQGIYGTLIVKFRRGGL